MQGTINISKIEVKWNNLFVIENLKTVMLNLQQIAIKLKTAKDNY
jgi:hypothetical protein